MKTILMLIVLIIGCEYSACAADPADPEAAAAPLVVRLLESQTIGKWKIDDARAAELLKAYVANLDPHRLYFLQSDWEEFQKREKSLDDQLKAADLSFVKIVQSKLKTRAAEAHQLAQRALQAKHDFTLEEVWPFPYDGFATDNAALAERWRLRIKGELLFEKANRATLSDAVTFLRGRYDSCNRHLKEMNENFLQELFLTTLCQICDPDQEYWGDGFWSNFHRGSSLGRLKYSAKLLLFPPAGDRLVIRRILHPLDDAQTRKDVLGWEVVAIYADPTKVQHTVGILSHAPQTVTDLWHRLEDATDITLELQHPKTLQRKTITWPRFRIER